MKKYRVFNIYNGELFEWTSPYVEKEYTLEHDAKMALENHFRQSPNIIKGNYQFVILPVYIYNVISE